MPVTNITIRGILALLLTLGFIGYYMMYQSVPVDLMVLTSTVVGYFFGHNSAESTSVSQRQNGTAVTPDVITAARPVPNGSELSHS